MDSKRDIMLTPLRLMNTLIDEGAWKNRLRAKLLSYRNALPRELMIRKGDVAIQVGMWRHRNVQRLSKCVGDAGRVILIEADKRNIDHLLPFLEENALNNVTVVHKAAWNARGQFDLCIGHEPSHNRLNVPNVQMLGEVNRHAFMEMTSTEVDTVDNILADIGVSDANYVEVSVNGVELQVLNGMTQTLQRVTRLFAAGYARAKDTHDPLNRRAEKFLQQQGFRTTITCKTPPTQADFDRAAASEWGWQEGHIFGWRE